MEDAGFSLCLALTSLTPLNNDGNVSVASGRDIYFYIGISIAVVSSLLQALGMSLQKFAHVAEQKKPVAERRRLCWSPHFMIGLFFYIISQTVGQTLALNYLSPVILAPLGSITLVFNAAFAKFLLKEEFSWRAFIGTGIVVIGAVLIAVFGYMPESDYELSELVSFFSSTAMIIFMSIAGGIAGFAFLGAKYLEWCKVNFENRPPLFRNMTKERLQSLLGIIYGAMAGILGSGTILLAKVSLQLLSTTFDGDNQFIYAGTYVIIGALVILAVLQVIFLNAGLAVSASTLVVPLFFCVWTVFTMMQTIAYYDQWECFSTIQIICITLGLATIFLGVAFLPQQKEPDADIGIQRDPRTGNIQEDDGITIQPDDFLVDAPESEVTPLLDDPKARSMTMRVASFSIVQPVVSSHRRYTSEDYRRASSTTTSSASTTTPTTPTPRGSSRHDTQHKRSSSFFV